MKKMIIISGPTATGKTLAAIDVAKSFNGEVVNFDSLNFYSEINIGTAKPTKEERSAVPHHLFDISSISTPLNAADFVRQALPLINIIHKNDKIPVLVGGSGFYLQALIEGMWDSPTTPPEIQKRSDDLYHDKGIEAFYEILKHCDPLTHARLHINDHYRIRRATEHFWTHGSPFSDAKNKLKNNHTIDWDIFHAYLDIPKEDHWKIIENRTKKMVTAGLVDEVKNILNLGFIGTEKPLQSIGYKETIDWIQGVYGGDQAAYLERLSINTRRLAKSQRTWFKKKEKIQYDIRHEHEKLMADLRLFMAQE